MIQKGTKKREINAPNKALKNIQQWLGHHLASAVKFDDQVFGFVRGRSAPLAAAVHCGATWVYSLDLADFFPTTSNRQVTAALETIGYPEHAATLISSLCCLGGNLPQGSPASPTLSNLVFSPLDKELQDISMRTGIGARQIVPGV